MLDLLLGVLCALQAPTQDPGPEPTAAPSTPTLGLWHELVFHERSNQLVLLNGGPEQGKPATDPLELWSWNGNEWRALPSDGPRWRNFASATCDAQRGVLVLQGGTRPDQDLADTWEWDGTNWTEHTGAGPGPREGAALTFDAARGVCVLFGGATRGKPMGDTWTFDGQRWQQSASAGPSPRFPGGFAYDPAREVVLLVGGHTVDQLGFRTHGDTWTWNGSTWEQVDDSGPSPRDGARAAFDPRSQSILLFGGAEVSATVRHHGDLWSWDGTSWTQLPDLGPPPRLHAALAFDPRRNVLVLTGGSNAPAKILPDTWEHDGNSWRCVAGCP
jgi:hypothetical protein